MRTNKFDPRSKLIFVASVSSLAVCLKSNLLLSAIVLISILTAVVLGADLLKAVRKLKSLLWMLFLIALLQSIFNSEGTVILDLYSFPLITSGGISEGIEFMLRMAIIIVSATVISTSNVRQSVQGLIQLKIPYEIAFLVSLGIRFLPMLTEEIKDSFTAIRLRGVIFKELTIKKKIEIYSYLFLPVIAGTIKNAEKIALSMETRGFRAKDKRTSLNILEYSAADHFLIAFSIIILLIFVLIQIK